MSWTVALCIILGLDVAATLWRVREFRAQTKAYRGMMLAYRQAQLTAPPKPEMGEG